MEPLDPLTAARIEEDHRLLRENLDALLAEMAKDVVPETYAVWKLDFLWRLRDFKHQLLKHFDLEEEGGFLDDVLRMAPRFRRTVEHLEEEHRKLIADLSHIVAVVKEIDDGASPRLPRVRERIRALIADFEAHESTENGLIQRVYYQDYGVGD